MLRVGSARWDDLADDWDRMAVARPTPFLTHAWLSCWWEAFGRGRRFTVTLRDRDGALRAAVLLAREPSGLVTSPVNAHSGDWNAVAHGDAERRELWARVAEIRAARLALAQLPADAADGPREALANAGWQTLEVPGTESPYLELPATFEELLQARSRNLRSAVGNRRRKLERQGVLRFRTTLGGPGLDRDLAALERVEMSGWKGSAGTAIASDPRTQHLYRRFAHEAADRGWLRLNLLELDGTAIAGDLGCVIGRCGFLVKTGFDEGLHRYSPGLVLRGEALRASIEEGLTGYDFLGGPDAYKLRWTDTVRPRVTVRAYRGVAARALGPAYWRSVRPTLKRGRELVSERRR